MFTEECPGVMLAQGSNGQLLIGQPLIGQMLDKLDI